MGTDAGAPLIFTPDYYRRMRELERHSWWNAGMRDVAASLLSLVPLPDRGTLLDVGCGSGQTMQWFLERHPAWKTYGLDVAIDGLRAAASAQIKGVLQASAIQLPFANATADLVISLDVLQHLPLGGGDDHALNEMKRVLKPGGHVLIRTNAQSIPHTPDDSTHQFHKYRTGELRAKLQASGLHVIRLGRLNALLGLAEIPREWRARASDHSYHGLLSEPRREPEWTAALKRAYLRFEGHLIRRGASLPLGRTILAICQG
jgi:ubiquinone/menaquinone biosynthesis C-methylase UbiE